MKCYKYIFNTSLLKNYGFFIFIFIFLLYFICLFLFYFKYYNSLKNIINQIKEAKYNSFNFNLNKNQSIETTNNITKKKKKKKKKRNSALNLNQNKSKSKKDHNFLFSRNNKGKKKKMSYIIKGRSNSGSNRFIIDNINNNLILDDGDDMKKDLKNKEISEYTDNELNSLEYKKALIQDNRTFTQYYISLLKKNHLLRFSFYCKNKDYNSPIIKMFLFFLFISVGFSINALFFNDDTMHKIYIDEGSFNIIFQLPQIIYSSLISNIINKIIDYSALSENNILEIKKVEKKEDLHIKVKDTFRILKIKFALFFIISFALLLMFMYYIICFCGIYENTQIHLIKDSLISFGLSLIYPFGTFLIPGIFRITALRAKDRDKEYQYKFSNFIKDIL